MSADDWYSHKAEECDRLAAIADATMRAKYKEEAVLWRQIARDAAKLDRATP